MNPRHKLSGIDVDGLIATCAVCGPETPIVVRMNGARIGCRNKRLAEQWASRRTVAGRAGIFRRNVRQRQHDVERSAELSAGLYRELLDRAQGRCEVCTRIDRRLVIDHSHDDGKVRGLLCNGCNGRLANLGDDLAGILREQRRVLGELRQFEDYLRK